MYAATNGVLDDEDDDDAALADMPPLDGSDEEAPFTDGENPDVGEVSPDEKENRGDGKDTTTRTSARGRPWSSWWRTSPSLSPST